MLDCLKPQKCQLVYFKNGTIDQNASKKEDETCGSPVSYAYFVSFIFFCSFLVSCSTIIEKRKWNVVDHFLSFIDVKFIRCCYYGQF